jgi:NADH:ubiquinone oxidoreductase subunit 2 (subunit N)
VIGLAYYARVVAVLFAPPETPARVAAPRLVAAAVGVVTVGALVVGLAPQLVLHAVDLAVGH